MIAEKVAQPKKEHVRELRKDEDYSLITQPLAPRELLKHYRLGSLDSLPLVTLMASLHQYLAPHDQGSASGWALAWFNRFKETGNRSTLSQYAENNENLGDKMRNFIIFNIRKYAPRTSRLSIEME